MSNNRRVLSVLLFVLPVSASAQGVTNDTLQRNGLNLGDPEFESTLREKYVHSSQLPDAFAFQAIIGTLSGINEKKPALALSMIRNRMGLDEAQSMEFLAMILAKHESLNSEINSTVRDLICSQGIPRVSGSEVYTALDASDDSEERIARKHLASLRHELSVDRVESFDQWISESKKTTVHLKFDHRKRFEQQALDPDAEVALMCGR